VSVVHIEITGRVQGIGFRWFVREQARTRNLAGWVRNLDSGGVEIAAAGPDPAMSAFLAAVNQGPPGALVRHVVKLSPVQDSDLPNPFTIIR